jgi:glutamate racemase
MHILITDSGVGGVSVVAYAERFVRTQGFTEPVRLTFANAAPANDYGYNSMPSREAKIETFDRFLRNVTERYAPDMIYVACNTLSVLRPDLKGVVDTGVALVVEQLLCGAGNPAGEVMPEKPPARLPAPHRDSVAVIFGTQTTIDSGVYPRRLQERGIDASRIVTQACPGLADVISEDRDGTKARPEIEKWVAAAVAKMPKRDAPIVACLACTHYGYRKDLFAEALGGGATVINPNESAVYDIFDHSGAMHDAEVEFITRYALPEATVETLTWLLQDISPKTVDAMQHYMHVPDLF